MSTFKFHSYIDDISSVEEVILQMLDLDEELHKSDLDNLRAFNTTYYIITKEVLENVNEGLFNDSELMSNFDVHFAQLYFDALKQYVDIGQTSEAWEKCFNFCKENKGFKFLYMALGINAHVNNDIPFVLDDLSIPDTYLTDYESVNPIIYENINEVVVSLEETNHFLGMFEMKTLCLYKIFLGIIISNWRQNAWNNYKHLDSKLITKENIILHAGNIADEIIKTGSFDFKQNPKIYKDFIVGNSVPF